MVKARQRLSMVCPDQGRASERLNLVASIRYQVKSFGQKWEGSCNLKSILLFSRDYFCGRCAGTAALLLFNIKCTVLKLQGFGL